MRTFAVLVLTGVLTLSALGHQETVASGSTPAASSAAQSAIR